MKPKEMKLYNVFFPVWMLLWFPQMWLIVLPGNFIIDSLVLLISMMALKMADKAWNYKLYIFKIYCFGMLSDLIGAVYMLVMVMQFHVGGSYGDELSLTLPALIIAAISIFIFNYFVTFKKLDKQRRFKLAMIFAIVTAPYTYLIPSDWIYH